MNKDRLDAWVLRQTAEALLRDIHLTDPDVAQKLVVVHRMEQQAEEIENALL